MTHTLSISAQGTELVQHTKRREVGQRAERLQTVSAHRREGANGMASMTGTDKPKYCSREVNITWAQQRWYAITRLLLNKKAPVRRSQHGRAHRNVEQAREMSSSSNMTAPEPKEVPFPTRLVNQEEYCHRVRNTLEQGGTYYGRNAQQWAQMRDTFRNARRIAMEAHRRTYEVEVPPPIRNPRAKARVVELTTPSTVGTNNDESTRSPAPEDVRAYTSDSLPSLTGSSD